MSILINESFSAPTTALWANVNTSYDKKQFGNPVFPAATISTGLIIGPSFTFSQSYQYAAGEGFLYFPSITYAGGNPTLLFWFSETTAGGENPSTTTDISYVSFTPSATGGACWIDLSKIKHYNPNGFTRLTLCMRSSLSSITLSAGNTVGSTWAGSGTSNVSTPVGTGNTATIGAGFVNAFKVL